MKKYIKEKINELTSLLEEELGTKNFVITINNLNKEVDVQSKSRYINTQDIEGVSKNGRN